MAQERPNSASTLPRNFQYHEFSRDDVFKTPERELGPSAEPAPLQPPPPQRYNLSTQADLRAYEQVRPQRYQLRRTSRQSRLNLNRCAGLGSETDSEMVVPSIELPDCNEASSENNWRHPQATPSLGSPGLLQPFAESKQSFPRTPSPQPQAYFADAWSSPKVQNITGGFAGRPESSLSFVSDSSDEDSDMDSDDGLSYGGSCTSPESEASSVSHRSMKLRLPAAKLTFDAQSPTLENKGKSRQVVWTQEMDNHLWACYMKYLNDPTVTPFKSWPGTAPPLGVCRRVAREAKRTWKGPKAIIAKEANADNSGTQLERKKSTDTITAMRSGSNTPVHAAAIAPAVPAWPKSSKSTRSRFRDLCKRKASIAPHYQRMLKSKSPEPFLGSGRSSHRPRFSSPDMFATREVRLSLATSTAVTMQPDGPMAQLSREPRNEGRPRSSSSWFNDTSVAWASPAPAPSSESSVLLPEAAPPSDPPSDIGREFMRFSSDPPRLGSPFMYNTWTSGNHRARRSLRPLRDDSASASVPRLRSPFELRGTFPYPNKPKRRAQAPLEDELSPSGSDRRQTIETDIFGGPVESRHRRVRARGFSYGDALTQGRLPTSHTPPPDTGAQTIHRFSMPASHDTAMSSFPDQPEPPRDTPRRLGSPFAGIGSRPTRSRRQMTPTPGIPGWGGHVDFPSIGETLNQPGQDQAHP